MVLQESSERRRQSWHFQLVKLAVDGFKADKTRVGSVAYWVFWLPIGLLVPIVLLTVFLFLVVGGLTLLLSPLLTHLTTNSLIHHMATKSFPQLMITVWGFLRFAGIMGGVILVTWLVSRAVEYKLGQWRHNHPQVSLVQDEPN